MGAQHTSRLVLHLEGVLSASAGRVFQALTEPEQLAAWWGPHGFTTSAIELDLAEGGNFRFTMQPPDAEAFHLQGEFRQIDPPRRVAYTFRWEEPDPDDVETLVTLSLIDLEGSTRLIVDQGDFATEARRALHERGWRDSLERLEALLAQR